jgi:hypothetical protein
MKSTTTRTTPLAFTTTLVERMKGNLDVQLRKADDNSGYYMYSSKTGTHFVPSENGVYTDRVDAHWKGFQLNQSN